MPDAKSEAEGIQRSSCKTGWKKCEVESGKGGRIRGFMAARAEVMRERSGAQKGGKWKRGERAVKLRRKEAAADRRWARQQVAAGVPGALSPATWVPLCSCHRGAPSALLRHALPLPQCHPRLPQRSVVSVRLPDPTLTTGPLFPCFFFIFHFSAKLEAPKTTKLSKSRLFLRGLQTKNKTSQIYK